MSNPARSSPRPPLAMLVPGATLVSAVLIVPLLVTLARGLPQLGSALGDSLVADAALNSLVWVIVVTAATTVFAYSIAAAAAGLGAASRGLFLAAFALPTALAFVVAGVAWRLVFDFRAAGDEQVGLVNQLLTTAGFAPVSWLTQQPLNTVLLAVVLAWCLAGGCALLLLPALRAARSPGLDPELRRGVGLVMIVAAAVSLEVYDLVMVTTGGAFGTSVLATEAIDRVLLDGDAAGASAVSVIALVAAGPLILLAGRRIGRELGVRR